MAQPPHDPGSRGGAPAQWSRRRVLGGVFGSLVLAAGAAGCSPAPGPTAPRVADPRARVRVTRSDDGWQLLVAGSAWFVKGVAYGLPQTDAEQHMDDIAALGANTVRTYSARPGETRTLLDAAHARGLMVVVGIWLPHDVDYRDGSGDAARLVTTRDEALGMVHELKDHPAVLLWNLGNEVIVAMKDDVEDEDELDERRAAYARYVERLASAVRDVDADHPVTSTDAGKSAWAYYRDHTPSLDLLAVNAYGDIDRVQERWEDGDDERPYLVTEAGAPGYWEVPEDVWGVPVEPTESEKAAAFTDAWGAVSAAGGSCLGATLFGYNDARTYLGMWRYLLLDGDRRPTWYAVRRLFTGPDAADPSPRVESLTLPDGPVAAGERFRVAADVSSGDDAPLTFEVLIADFDAIEEGSYAVDGRKPLASAVFTDLGSGRFAVVAPREPGAWKIYVVARNGSGSVAVAPGAFVVEA